MNRQRQGGRDRRPSYQGGDGLLGEGPGFGGAGVYEPMVNSQVNQLLLMQQLLQQQAGLGRTGGYGDGLGSLSNRQFQQQQSQGMGFSGDMGGRNVGGIRNDRKRLGGNSRDNDFKRRRNDSPGRGGDRDRSRGRDGNRGGESRDRKHSSRWESDRDRGYGKEDAYNPAEPTDELHDREGKLFCHVCNKTMYDDESFRRHLSSQKHTQMMNSVLTIHQVKSNQLKFRMKAEEHLRKIEGGKGSFNPEYFCKICNNNLTIPWERHRFSKIHTQRQLQVTRGCGWCKVHDFKNFTEVLEHRETDEHKKNAELLGKKKDEKERRRSRSRDRRSETHRKRSDSRDKGKKDREQKEKKKQEDEEDLTIPEYNAEKAVGLNYIVPVTGFFCKLCHKFYNNENSAKGAHCQGETHYEKFKLATEAKIAEREKRLQEEAAAEAEKKSSEEDKDVAVPESEEGKSKESEADVKEEETKKEGNKDEDIDEEDYDDELPLEDLDDDGGLVKDDELELLDDDEINIMADSGLNDTNANSSFVYLSGEMAEAQLEEKKKELTTEEDKEVTDKSATVAVEEITKALPEDEVDLTVEADEKQADSSLITPEEEEEALAAPATAEPVKTSGKTRGSGTARRGRGRGRGKK